jgi:hypothetical protein
MYNDAKELFGKDSNDIAVEAIHEYTGANLGEWCGEIIRYTNMKMWEQVIKMQYQLLGAALRTITHLVKQNELMKNDYKRIK